MEDKDTEILNKKRCPRHQALYTMAGLAAFTINKLKGIFFFNLFLRRHICPVYWEEGSYAGSAKTEGRTRRAQFGCQEFDKV